MTFQHLYNQWMTTTKYEPTNSERIKCNWCAEVCELIHAQCHSLSPETVDKIFKVTGISNEMDGSEDFMINAIDNESYSNYNGDNSSIGSGSECHKNVSELLTDDTDLSQTAYY
jgi:hypothetical protein